MLSFLKRPRQATVIRRATVGRFTLIQADPGGPGEAPILNALMALRREGARAHVAFGRADGAGTAHFAAGMRSPLTSTPPASLVSP